MIQWKQWELFHLEKDQIKGETILFNSVINEIDSKEMVVILVTHDNQTHLLFTKICYHQNVIRFLKLLAIEVKITAQYVLLNDLWKYRILNDRHLLENDRLGTTFVS